LEKELKNNRWIDVPMSADVWHLLKEQRIADTYYARGNGDATQDLDWVEATHRNWVHDITDLSDFPYCYVTNGTTDAIHHWLQTEDRQWQYIKGDYEYPNMIDAGTEIDHSYFIDPHKVLYLSNPFAGDGMFRDVEVDCPVILDCTYVSATAKQRIHIPKNTEQVMFSFSKGFGMIGNRCGLVYTKKPHKTLHLLKEFENWNYATVKTMDLIMSNFAVDEMFDENRGRQLALCSEYSLIPADVFFLAQSGDNYYKRRRRMFDSPTARLCLTPLW
jgi:hypothetical protein